MENPTPTAINALINAALASFTAQSQHGATTNGAQRAGHATALGAPTAATLPDWHKLLSDALSATTTANLPSITVADAIKAFRADRDAQWTASTKKEADRMLPWLEEHLGPSTPLRAVKKAHAISFRNALLTLEKNSTAPSFAQRMTDDPARRIAKRTASKYLDFAQMLFGWATNEAGYIEYSPFNKITIKFKKGKSNAAQAATPKALEAFFLSPLFQGHKYGKYHEAGAVVERGERYWFVLAEFFLGARAGEVAQLRVNDVTNASSGIAQVHFRTTDDHGQYVEGKSLKTASSERTVPIPEAFIRLGFLDFVKRQNNGKRIMLFPYFAPRPGSSASARATKFMSRYLEGIDQKAPGKANHWFRHGLSDALRNGVAQGYLISQITGHAENNMNAQYGMGANINAAKHALDNANYQFDPLEILLRSKKRWLR